MKIKFLSAVAIGLASLAFTSCSEETLSDTSVIPDGSFGQTAENDSEFDKWIKDNYTTPYNIRLQYRYLDKETDLTYNVVPAKIPQSKALAKLVKHIWIGTYEEAIGQDFIKTYTPRVIQLIGSYEWNSNGSQVMGTAEGGLKIMLYGVNYLDINNPRINSDNPYESKSSIPLDLNYWFFHTMHHEFCHILTQTKEYPTDFRTISAGKYHATDWINVKDEDAPKEGFVTGYASGEYNEDFAEVYANYVTLSDAGWQKILDKADDEGKAIINQKLAMVKEYFMNSWGVDLDNLRTIVLRRSQEAVKMDLHTLD